MPPPLYEFRCQKCRKEVEVIQSFKDSDKEPEEGCDCSEGETSDWKKWISKPPTEAFGSGWRGRKGHW